MSFASEKILEKYESGTLTEEQADLLIEVGSREATAMFLKVVKSQNAPSFMKVKAIEFFTRLESYKRNGLSLSHSTPLLFDDDDEVVIALLEALKDSWSQTSSSSRTKTALKKFQSSLTEPAHRYKSRIAHEVFQLYLTKKAPEASKREDPKPSSKLPSLSEIAALLEKYESGTLTEEQADLLIELGLREAGSMFLKVVKSQNAPSFMKVKAIDFFTRLESYKRNGLMLSNIIPLLFDDDEEVVIALLEALKDSWSQASHSSRTKTTLKKFQSSLTGGESVHLQLLAHEVFQLYLTKKAPEAFKREDPKPSSKLPSLSEIAALLEKWNLKDAVVKIEVVQQECVYITLRESKSNLSSMKKVANLLPRGVFIDIA